MNICIFTGNISRLNKLQDTSKDMKYIKFTIAVDRKNKGEKSDFIGMTAFGKTAEFLANWCSVGTKVAVHSHFQQGSYQKDGKTVYTNDFIVDSLEKLSSKKDAEAKDDYGFVNIEADGLNDEGLPFN